MIHVGNHFVVPEAVAYFQWLTEPKTLAIYFRGAIPLMLNETEGKTFIEAYAYFRRKDNMEKDYHVQTPQGRVDHDPPDAYKYMK